MTPEDLVLALFWSDSVRSLLALAIGFAVAGLLSSGYQQLTLQPASFKLLHEAERRQALAAVPFLVFAAPFIMVRDAIHIRRSGTQNFVAGMVVSMIAGVWSLLSGKFVMQAFAMLGLG